MTQAPGRGLLLLLVASMLLFQAGREALRGGESPAFFVSGSPLYVWLGEGFPAEGVRQFNDDATLRDVMQLTDGGAGIELSAAELDTPLETGELLEIKEENDGGRTLRRSLMSAAQRLVLSIPLHPDRMSAGDWTALKGVGPALAGRIEADRQENGDFGSLEGLLRVKGIGPKRIEAWRPHFLNSDNAHN